MDTSTMFVNGQPTALPEPPTLGTLLTAMGIDRRGVAVAVNRQVVRRSRWDATRLRPGDRVELLGAAQGG